MLQLLPAKVKLLLDAANWSIVGATLIKVLPPLAAVLSIVYTSLLIYDRYKKNKKGS